MLLFCCFKYKYHVTVLTLKECWDGLNTGVMTPISYTKNGITCQPWTDDRPHVNVDYEEDHMFPDGSVEAAKTYCRFCLFVCLFVLVVF